MNAIKKSLGIGEEPQSRRSMPNPPSIPPRPPSNRSTLPGAIRDLSLTSPEGSDDASDGLDVKNKLVSMWNSMKYGKALWSMETKTSFSKSSPVWLMGVCYHKKMSQYPDPDMSIPMGQQVHSFGEDDAGIEAFTSDFSSRLWLTYRREFQEFSGTSINTDCGWGCMIRSGQMLLANTLLIQKLGRKWRWRENMREVYPPNGANDEQTHQSIIRLFGDSPNTKTSPLSIHQLVSVAKETMGRQPGDWFGPSSTAHLLQAAVDRASHHPLLNDIKVYIARDCTVYRDDVYELCSTKRARKSQSREPSVLSCNDEEYSILEHPLDYMEHVPIESCNQSSRLRHSTVPGVPYIEDRRMVENCERQFSLNQEVQVMSDDSSQPWLAEGIRTSPETHMFSLNQSVRVNEDQSWTAEGPASTVEVTPLPSSLVNRKLVEDSWTPVLILIPVRLGGEKFNPLYGPCIRSFLATEYCVGIIGGRPKHSLYFIGFQDDSLIHLDPHLVQDRVDVFRREFDPRSFHCRNPRKMALNRMDPSCSFGFFIETRQDFERWRELAADLAIPPASGGQKSNYPMFEVVNGKAEDVTSPTAMSDVEFNSASASSSDGEVFSEDFVFI